MGDNNKCGDDNRQLTLYVIISDAPIKDFANFQLSINAFLYWLILIANTVAKLHAILLKMPMI